MKSCCVTGHREIPQDKIHTVEQELRKEIKTALDDGIRLFTSGFADGADLLFARIVLEYKETYSDIFLEAALPYPAKKKRNKEYHELLLKCSGAKVCSPEYSRDCYLTRNRYMVFNTDRVIAVYDGRDKGGTVNTLRYAQSLGKDIRKISI